MVSQTSWRADRPSCAAVDRNRPLTPLAAAQASDVRRTGTATVAAGCRSLSLDRQPTESDAVDLDHSDRPTPRVVPDRWQRIEDHAEHPNVCGVVTGGDQPLGNRVLDGFVDQETSRREVVRDRALISRAAANRSASHVGDAYL